MPRYKFVKRIEKEDEIPENSKAANKSREDIGDPFEKLLKSTKIEKAIRKGNQIDEVNLRKRQNTIKAIGWYEKFDLVFNLRICL